MNYPPRIRLRVLPALLPKNGRDIELQATDTFIQWRYVGDAVWTDLIPLSEITGPIGPGTELQSDGVSIQWRAVGDADWNDLIPLSAITGETGPEGPQGPIGPGLADGDKGDVVVSGTGTAWGISPSAKSRIMGVAADRTALAAMDGTTYLSVDLNEAGRKGLFYWDGSDLSASVTLDTAQGLYVAPATDTTGASGAWVRQFTGDPFVTWFGAKFDGATNDTTAIHAAFSASPKGSTVRAPGGTAKCNILVPDNIQFTGAGRRKTILKGASSASPVVELGDATAIETWFLSLSDLEIDGEGTAVEGLRLGRSSSSRTSTYARVSKVYIHDCVDNIHLQSVVGLEMSHVYSYSATDSALRIDATDIVTTVKFSNCQFRLSTIGCELLGGALLEFDTCVVESNKNTGLFFTRSAVSGARQVSFRNSWFENNGQAYTLLGTAGGMYLDMATSQVTALAQSSLSFEDCTISSPTVSGVILPDVTLQRGSDVTFRRCQFSGLNTDRLKFSSGTGYCFATLFDCGTTTTAASPTLYASFPAQVVSGSKQLGYSYEYMYQGKRYTSVVAGP